MSPALATSPPTLGPSAGGSLRADVLSGYVLTGSRLAAWAGVSAVAYRWDGPEAFALLALLRGTITLVGYTSLGLGPAMVRMLAEAARAAAAPAGETGRTAEAAATPAAARPTVLDYEVPRSGPRPRDGTSPAEQGVFASGNVLSFWLFALAGLATVVYAAAVNRVHVIPAGAELTAVLTVLGFGLGVAFRIGAEPASAALQVRGHVAVDNVVTAAGEWAWLATAVAMVAAGAPAAPSAGLCWLFASVAVVVARTLVRNALAPGLSDAAGGSSWPQMRRLAAFGATLLVAQLADFLYAPTDYVLINRLLSPADVAAYAPAVQVDAALLLLVGGLAATLFPHAAVAYAAGDTARLRRLYVKGTLASAAVLLAAGGATLAASPWLFRLWLGDDLPATRALLPLVLVHTVVGGSSGIGRSVLLGMGRVRALTVSALMAGAANVVLSATFATVGGLGLMGIVLGTVVVVVARCAVWMPWYVWRALRAVESDQPGRRGDRA
jgi:O-antigen/teichoic acid export membrane protein